MPFRGIILIFIAIIAIALVFPKEIYSFVRRYFAKIESDDEMNSREIESEDEMNSNENERK